MLLHFRDLVSGLYSAISFIRRSAADLSPPRLESGERNA